MKINEAWEQLYKAAMSRGRESQLNYISLIAEKLRNIPTQYLIDEQALFIPNDDYVANMAGPLAMQDSCGFYYSGESTWSNYLIFPIKGMDDTVKGIGGFNPTIYLQAHETGDFSAPYYSYSAKSLFPKGDYLFWGPDGFIKAYNAGYVVLVDGMFDAIQLRGNGYYAAALMGSSVTESLVAQLRFFDKIIVISDNDTAGNKLESLLKRELKHCVYLRQGYDKDVDGAIKKGYKEEVFSVLNRMIEEPFYIDRIA